MEKKVKLILASASPRRIELLTMLGCNFEVMPSKIEEKIDSHLSPVQNIKKLSYLKASDVVSKISDGIVIAADTDVVLNEKVFGKPKNKKEAYKMLKELSGNEHQVITSVTVINAKTKKMIQEVVVTKVTLQKFNKKLIEKYINSDENLLDKAGAYAIQGKGSLLTESIKGDYFSVVGLPLNTLNKILEKFGVDLLS